MPIPAFYALMVQRTSLGRLCRERRHQSACLLRRMLCVWNRSLGSAMP